MSKSKGNFILLEEAIRGHREMEVRDDDDKVIAIKTVGWTSDTTRVALADGGDGLDDANFACDVADTAIMRLFNELRFAEEVIAMPADNNNNIAESEAAVLFRNIFIAKLDQCIINADEAYATMRYRDALVAAFFNMQEARDNYRHSCILVDIQPKKALLLRYLSILSIILSPICPHVCDYIWRNILQVDFSVIKASWPIPSMTKEIRNQTLSINEYIVNVETKARLQMDKYLLKHKDVQQIDSVVVRVSKTVPLYHEFVLTILKEKFPNPNKSTTSDEVIKIMSTELKSKPEFKKFITDAMKISRQTFEEAQKIGNVAYDVQVPFDELHVLEILNSYFVKALKVNTITAKMIDSNNIKDSENITPGKPGFELGVGSNNKKN
jgi:leucyl-tRNA synthetase